MACPMNANGEGRHRGAGSIPRLTLSKGGECAAWREKREGRGEVTQGEVTYPKWWLNRGRTRACKSLLLYFLATVFTSRRCFLLWRAGAASAEGEMTIFLRVWILF